LRPAMTYRRRVVGLELETVRNAALIAIAVAVVLAVALVLVIKAVIGKLVPVVLLGALAAVVWSQRESVQDCADRVGARLEAGAVDDTTCTFFGRHVTITSPLGD
jgi:hypothetical protein